MTLFVFGSIYLYIYRTNEALVDLINAQFYQVLWDITNREKD